MLLEAVHVKWSFWNAGAKVAIVAEHTWHAPQALTHEQGDLSEHDLEGPSTAEGFQWYILQRA